MDDAFLTGLESLIGAESVDTACDPPVFRPTSAPIMAETVMRCHANRRGIALTGAGTFPVPGDPGDLVRISTSALDTVSEVNVDDFIVVAQAGVVVDDLVSVAGQFGLHLPVSLTSGDRATVGGTFMSGAFAGGRPPGRIDRLVTGVRAVTGNGEVVTFGGRTVKNVTGFEVTRFLGGTLGLYAVAAEVTIKALPMPEYRMTLTVTVPGEQALPLVCILAGQPDAGGVSCDLIAPEGLAGSVTAGIAYEGFRDIVTVESGRLADACGGLAGVSVKSRNERCFTGDHRVLASRLAIPGMLNLRVPPSAMPVFMERLAAMAPESPLIAHLGHGRVHLAGVGGEIQAAIDVFARSLGGPSPVIWGGPENGGIAPMLTAPERSLARSLKRELDPLGILNPHIAL